MINYDHRARISRSGVRASGTDDFRRPGCPLGHGSDNGTGIYGQAHVSRVSQPPVSSPPSQVAEAEAGANLRTQTSAERDGP
jgi:hypothetical protein